jgi:hypothetical protein
VIRYSVMDVSEVGGSCLETKPTFCCLEKTMINYFLHLQNFEPTAKNETNGNLQLQQNYVCFQFVHQRRHMTERGHANPVLVNAKVEPNKRLPNRNNKMKERSDVKTKASDSVQH